MPESSIQKTTAEKQPVTESCDRPRVSFVICPIADANKRPQFFDDRQEAEEWLECRRGQGWIEEPLPVISVGSSIGRAFTAKRLFEWMPPAQIPVPPVIPADAVTASLVEMWFQEVRGETAWPKCFLDFDWHFKDIEREASKLEGHHYGGKQHTSLRQLVWKAACDLDSALVGRHPDASASARAHFFQSWQVHNHLRRMCKEQLPNSIAAGNVQLGWESPDEAGMFVLRQLSNYATSISMGEEGVSSNRLSPASVNPVAPVSRHVNDRRAAVDAYIAEVLRSKGKTITRTDIWKKAGYKSRTEFERWERHDVKKLNKSADERFTRMLHQKPHLT